MKKLILATVIALVPTLSNAQTKTLDCSFTEPFFSLEVNLENKTVTRTEPDWGNPNGGEVTTEIAKDIVLKTDISDPLLPKYEVLNQDGGVILTLEMNMNGSDGMSDIIFPYSAKHRELWGGCDSDKVKRIFPNEGY